MTDECIEPRCHEPRAVASGGKVYARCLTHTRAKRVEKHPHYRAKRAALEASAEATREEAARERREERAAADAADRLLTSAERTIIRAHPPTVIVRVR